MATDMAAEPCIAGRVIDILREADGWPQDYMDHCRHIAAAALAAERVQGPLELAILLGDDRRLAALNRDFRGHDRPTNVLAFPGESAPPDNGAARHLGDIALAWQTVRAQAGEEGKSLKDHLGHLVVHGVLHLLGYSHEEAATARCMEARERAILADLGIADPYADMSGDSEHESERKSERERNGKHAMAADAGSRA